MKKMSLFLKVLYSILPLIWCVALIDFIFFDQLPILLFNISEKDFLLGIAIFIIMSSIIILQTIFLIKRIRKVCINSSKKSYYSSLVFLFIPFDFIYVWFIDDKLVKENNADLSSKSST